MANLPRDCLMWLSTLPTISMHQDRTRDYYEVEDYYHGVSHDYHGDDSGGGRFPDASADVSLRGQGGVPGMAISSNVMGSDGNVVTSPNAPSTHHVSKRKTSRSTKGRLQHNWL